MPNIKNARLRLLSMLQFSGVLLLLSSMLGHSQETLTVLNGNALVAGSLSAEVILANTYALVDPGLVTINFDPSIAGISLPGSGSTAIIFAGNISLNATPGVAFSGGATVTSGTLALGSGGGNIFASSPVSLTAAGTTFDISNAGNQTIQDLTGVTGSTVSLGANILTAGSSNSTTFSGLLTGTGGLTKVGTGALTLSGANTYTGATTISVGTLTIGLGGSLASSSGLNLANTGTILDISGAGNQTIQDLTGITGSTVSLGANTLTAGTAHSTTFSGLLSGTGGLIKQGTGVLTLNGANTYTGTTTINNGTLALGLSGNLSASAGLNLANTGAILNISGGGNQTIQDLTGVTGTTVNLGANTLTEGTINSTTFSGLLAGTGGLIKQGAGTLTLNGANTFTGLTTINAGKVALGLTGSLASSSGLDLANSGTILDISGGGNQTIQDLTGVSGSTVILGSNTLTAGTANSTTFAGLFSGTGGLTKQGTGTLTLTGANTFTGFTTINSGRLSLGLGGSLATSVGLNLANSGTIFDISGAGNQTIKSLSGVTGSTVNLGANLLTEGTSISTNFSGLLSGTGGLIKQGTGTLTLNGANTFTGATTVNGGTLALGLNGSLSSSAGVNLAGIGSGLDISGGGNQTIQDLTGVLGSAVNLGANTLTEGTANSTTFSGLLYGTGGLIKQGTGILTLNGTNTFTGFTTINTGGLALGSTSSLASSAGLNLANTGTVLDISGAGNQTIQDLTGVTGSTINLGANLLTEGTANSTTFAGLLAGTGGLIKQGTGTLTLNGANTYTGATTINSGKLALGLSGSLASSASLNLANTGTIFDISGGGNQTILDLTGVLGSTVNLGANTLTAGTANSTTFSGLFSGTGGLIKQGAGTLTLNGANTFTGLTTINAGKLALGLNGSLASSLGLNLANTGTILDISGAGNQTIQDLTGVTGSTVNLGANILTAGTGNSTTFAGLLSGTGGLIKQGTGTLTLNGANTYTGATTVNAGTLALGLGGNLASSVGVNLANTGSGLDISGAGNQTIQDLTGALGTTVNLGANFLTTGTTNSTTFSGLFSGTGGLIKQGTGTLTLNGSNTFTGLTTINAGKLALGLNGSLASSAGLNLANTGTILDISGSGNQTIQDLTGVTGSTINLGVNLLTTGTANSTTFSGLISGTGGLIKQGTGTLTLSGANTYTGATTINVGTLAIGLGGNLASSDVLNLANSGAILDISGAGNQTIQDLTGVTGSTVNLGANLLTAGTANSTTFSGLLSGTGGLIKQGAGTLTLNGVNTFTGDTTINVGKLAIGLGGSLASSAEVNLANTGTILDISGGGNQTIQDLTGVAGSTVNLGANLLTAGTANSTAFSGLLSGTGGLIKQGTGTLTLNGVNTFTGATTINGGTLALGLGASLADSAGLNLANTGAILDISGAGNQTIQDLTGVTGTTVNLGANILSAGTSNSTSFAGSLTGTGGLIKLGTGTLTLLGSNTFTGGTTISLGTLQIGNGGSTGNLLGNITDNGTLAVNLNTGLNLNGIISGTGGLTQLGTGTLTLSGNNTFSGGVTINAGTVLAGLTTALGTGNVTVNGGSLGSTTGTLMVDIGGNYTQGSGGTLDVGVNGSTSGGLSVAGNTSLGGGLQVNLQNVAPPAGGQPVVVVTTGGTTTGGFTTTTTNLPTVTVTTGTGTTGQTVYMLKQQPFVVAAQTPNAQSVATTVDNVTGATTTTNSGSTTTTTSGTTGSTSTGTIYTGTGVSTITPTQSSAGFTKVVAALNNTSPNSDALNNALTQLTPLGFASFGQSTIINNSDFVSQQFDSAMSSLRREDGSFIEGNGQIDTSGLMILNTDPGLAPISSRLMAWTPGAGSEDNGHVYAGFDDKGLAPVAPENNESRLPWDVFVQGTVIMAQDFSQKGLAHANVNTGGFQASADYHITSHFLVGAGFAYNHTGGDLDTLGSKATLDSYVPSLYASYVNGGWFVNGMANYGFNSLTEDRHMDFGGFTGVSHGATNGDQELANLDGGYEFHMKSFTFGPTFGAQYTHFNIDSYKEQGAPGANLAVGNEFDDSLRTRLGGQVRYTFMGFGLSMSPHANVSWQHECLNQNKSVSSSFEDIGSGTFETTLPGDNRDSALVNAGFDLQINKNVMGFADYSLQAGQSHFIANSVQAGVRIDF